MLNLTNGSKQEEKMSHLSPNEYPARPELLLKQIYKCKVREKSADTEKDECITVSAMVLYDKRH